jgi:hypothetical protein
MLNATVSPMRSPNACRVPPPLSPELTAQTPAATDTHLTHDAFASLEAPNVKRSPSPTVLHLVNPGHRSATSGPDHPQTSIRANARLQNLFAKTDSVATSYITGYLSGMAFSAGIRGIAMGSLAFVSALAQNGLAGLLSSAAAGGVAIVILGAALVVVGIILSMLARSLYCEVGQQRLAIYRETSRSAPDAEEVYCLELAKAKNIYSPASGAAFYTFFFTLEFSAVNVVLGSLVLLNQSMVLGALFTMKKRVVTLVPVVAVPDAAVERPENSRAAEPSSHTESKTKA